MPGSILDRYAKSWIIAKPEISSAFATTLWKTRPTTTLLQSSRLPLQYPQLPPSSRRSKLESVYTLMAHLGQTIPSILYGTKHKTFGAPMMETYIQRSNALYLLALATPALYRYKMERWGCCLAHLSKLQPKLNEQPTWRRKCIEVFWTIGGTFGTWNRYSSPTSRVPRVWYVCRLADKVC
jgi:hypothetical protein